MKRWPESEKDLAKPIIEWFEDRGWDVYQEVLFRGPIADIVATLNGRVWVVELKRNFGLKVIEQAEFWRRNAHFTSIAIPKKKTSFHAVSALGGKICRDYGIGIFEVRQNENVKEEIRPRLMRFMDRKRNNGFMKKHDDWPSNLLNCLTPERKAYGEAGSSEGGHFTEFRYTCDKMSRLVKKNPGICLKDAISELDHHYSSDSTARQSMSMWVDAGKIPNVKKVRDGKHVRFYPVDAE